MSKPVINVPKIVGNYAERFQTVLQPGHHVASPLSAWLLLALVGPAARGEDAASLEEVLGCDREVAASAAAELVAHPHPVVATAVAAWHRTQAPSEAFSRWIRGLPDDVETGEIPDQKGADEWTRRRTLEMIERFPIGVEDEAIRLVLASALASWVSWETPFEVAPADVLGPESIWSGRLERVLQAPAHRSHVQLIARSARSGDVAVHAARARDGLLVVSVAADANIPPADVLADAHEIAIAIATGEELGRRRWLFEMPLGSTPQWTITEQLVQTEEPEGHEERYATFLPAWSARSRHNLAASSTGFPAAAHTLSGLLGPGPDRFDAAQVATARYSRYGFEAAAVTAVAPGAGAPQLRDGVRRLAELRFAHPFAVVAVTVSDREGIEGPWHGLPVFSAWVEEPTEVPAEEEPGAG